MNMDMNNQSMEDIKNPKLIQALQDMKKHDNLYTRGVMAQELMQARLLSPIQTQTLLTEKDGPSTRIRFMDIANTEGEKFYMAFTDLDEYAKWNSDGKHNQALIMTMEEYGNILIRNINDLKGFVINPYGENVSISKSLLLSLLKQQEAKQGGNRGN